MIESISKRETFALLSSEGIKVQRKLVSMVYVKLETDSTEVAFAIGRKFGNAVKRNRARRRIKHAIDAAYSNDGAASGAYLVLASRAVLDADFQNIVDDVAGCFAKARTAGSSS